MRVSSACFRSLPFHPFLFASYPVLFLYSHNRGMVGLQELWLPLFLANLLAGALWAGFMVFNRDLKRSAVLASVTAFLVLMFGSLSDLLSFLTLVSGDALAKVLIWGWGMVLAFVITRVVMGKIALHQLHPMLNFVGLLLVAMTLISILPFELARNRSTASIAAATSAARLKDSVPTMNPQDLPDIYDIVLDGYAGKETLKRIYQLDNGPFESALRQRGFEFSDGARANYCQTVLSLASTLQMDSLDEIVKPLGPESSDRKPVSLKAMDSRVLRMLRQLGYRAVAYQTGYEPTEMRKADLYVVNAASLTFFQNAAFELTPFPALWREMQSSFQDEYADHRARILGMLRGLGDLDDRQAPLFVFAHVVSPHPPFVFDATGKERQPARVFTFHDGDHFRGAGGTREEYIQQYREQIQYVNQMVIQAVDRILEKSKRPPIIFIHSDHGPGSGLAWEHPDQTDMPERFSILMSGRFPGIEGPVLTENMTPVNLYKILFNRYFNYSIPMQRDESFFSTWEKPYRFYPVTDQLN